MSGPLWVSQHTAICTGRIFIWIMLALRKHITNATGWKTVEATQKQSERLKGTWFYAQVNCTAYITMWKPRFVQFHPNKNNLRKARHDSLCQSDVQTLENTHDMVCDNLEQTKAKKGARRQTCNPSWTIILLAAWKTRTEQKDVKADGISALRPTEKQTWMVK